MPPIEKLRLLAGSQDLCRQGLGYRVKGLRALWTETAMKDSRTF